jgi:hypothetical protein
VYCIGQMWNSLIIDLGIWSPPVKGIRVLRSKENVMMDHIYAPAGIERKQ